MDFSCNQISEMCDLSAYQALTKLILDSILWTSKGEILVNRAINNCVPDDMEWYQISSLSEMGYSFKWLRIDIHKMREDIFIYQGIRLQVKAYTWKAK